ncbi:hypothetical protein [Streptomyces sp. TLI_171]|uniref:hypothetical protein n=1 Tax=Streptomyces sp. TLI_171 TaxID=1938859 RepID=UPI000C19B2EE|nr:hypothetical protein [Streptomyces sp. TLI_171]RKE20281.1 hypothetical protein BX266_3634 [Streptomyces sp. TLI_171]
MKTTLSRTAKAAVAATAALAGALAVPAEAQATTYTVYVNNNCNTDPNPDCYSGVNNLYVYYSQNGTGAGARFFGNVPNYDGTTSGGDGIITYYAYRYDNDGAGAGQGVRNNAASVVACSSAATYRVYYSPSYQGSSQLIEGDWGCDTPENLASWLRNENASQHWG